MSDSVREARARPSGRSRLYAIGLTCPDLSGERSWLSSDLVNTGRLPEDDACIVEVWV